jgi:PAS domain S-box-containing protein
MAKKAKKSPASELRRAKQALADMRARYIDLYDLAPAGIFTLDAKGVILEANLTLAALLGVKKDVLLKQPFSGFLPPEERARFQQHVMLSTKKQAPAELLTRMTRPNADTFWARLEVSLGYGGNNALMYRVVLNDVSELMQTRLEMLRLRAAIDHAHDGIAIADMEGLLQFSNLAWAQMHGYTPEELVGRPLSIGHTKEQLENDVIPFQKNVLAHGSWAGEVGHVRKDGTTFPTWMSTVLLRDAEGKATGFIGMAGDLTARREADEYLARILSEREAILKSIPDLFYRLDAEMNLQDWNPVFERVSGYPPETLKGMHALKFFKTDAQVIAEGIQEAVAKGQAYRTGRLLTRRGAEIPIFWSAAALRSPEGKLLGLVGIGRDLTVK